MQKIALEKGLKRLEESREVAFQATENPEETLKGLEFLTGWV
jgi:hypothetical protein